MISLNARKRAIGIITGGRVDALEGAGLVVVEMAELEALREKNDHLKACLEWLEARNKASTDIRKELRAENERLYKAFGRIYEENLTIDEIEKAIDECAKIEDTLKKMEIARDRELEPLCTARIVELEAEKCQVG